MDTSGVTHDLEAIGHDLVKKAESTIDALLDVVNAEVGTALPTLEADGVAIVTHMAGPWGGALGTFLGPVLAGTLTKMNGPIETEVAKGIAFAKARIDAIAGV